jgi:hypothetical protein
MNVDFAKIPTDEALKKLPGTMARTPFIAS